MDHIKDFKKRGCGINIAFVVIATALSAVYFYFAYKLTKDCFIDDPYESGKAFYKDYNKTRTMQWIISAIFSVMMILMGLSLILKVKHRYEDFYADYKCYLWTVSTIQALAMVI